MALPECKYPNTARALPNFQNQNQNAVYCPSMLTHQAVSVSLEIQIYSFFPRLYSSIKDYLNKMKLYTSLTQLHTHFIRIEIHKRPKTTKLAPSLGVNFVSMTTRPCSRMRIGKRVNHLGLSAVEVCACAHHNNSKSAGGLLAVLINK